MPMTEVISKNMHVEVLKPEYLISIADYIRSHKQVRIDSLFEEFKHIKQYLIKEALFILEEPKFFDINLDPVIKKEDGLVKLISSELQIASLLHHYRNDVYPHVKALYLLF